MMKITTRGGCRVKDARSPKRWGVIYVYIAGHWFLTSPGVQLHPGHIAFATDQIFGRAVVAGIGVAPLVGLVASSSRSISTS